MNHSHLFSYPLGTPKMRSTLDCSISLHTTPHAGERATASWADDTATMSICTGSCRVQTYLTPQALRDVAAGMVAAADALDVRAASEVAA